MRIKFILFFNLCLHFQMNAGGYDYTLSWESASSHIYSISLIADATEGKSTDFQIPAWRPGRYFEQKYAAGISAFEALDQKGKKLPFEKIDRDTWQVKNPGAGKIEIRYHFYAHEMDAGSSYLSPAMAYFNGSNIFMHVRDRYEVPCTLNLPSLPDNWKVATALHKTDAKKFTATDYHELVDSPTIFSPTLKEIPFEVDGVKFWFEFQGNFLGNDAAEDTLVKNISKIIREQKAVFGELPLAEYHFIIQLLPYNLRHAVEHCYSSCYALPETVTKDIQTIAGMYGIISHEFFHLWNVKRIRPAALWPYDYQKIPYTTLHWFTEGVTDYYADLTLVRSGITSRETFFTNESASLTLLENNFAAKEISPGLASYDSWLNGSEYADPHRQVSYYPLGEKVGLLLDLELRKSSGGSVGLDDLMKYLYETYYKKNIGVPENGILDAAIKLAGFGMKEFFTNYVSGVIPINYKGTFKPFGLTWEKKQNDNVTWQKIGIDRAEKANGGIAATLVNPGGESANAGLGDGDFIIELNGLDATKLNEKDFFEKLKKNDEIKLKVYSDGNVKDIVFTYKESKLPVTGSLTIDEKQKEKEKSLMDTWLNSKVN